MKKFLIALIALSIFLNTVTAEYSYKRSLSLTVTDSEKGDGYYMSYRDIRSHILYDSNNDLEAKDYGHGSGRFDLNSILSANSSQDIKSGSSSAWVEDYNNGYSCVNMKIDNKMTYGPANIKLGTGYYDSRPLALDSLLKERAWVKNRATETSMLNEIEYARTLNKSLQLQTYKQTWYDNEYENTHMNISETIGGGKAHVGLYQRDILEYGKVPLAIIDEDFLGNFSIEKNMNLASSIESSTSEDWLPCCSGGYDYMNFDDKKPLGADDFFNASTDRMPINA
jgi:hypothetical protein